IEDYLRLIQLSDTCIDCPSWNGGNTTIETLTLGKPIVTLPGKFMRSRHSLAFLTQANVSGLVAADEEDFIELVLNRDRQLEAMRGLNAEALYNDLGPAKALSEHLLSGW